MKLVWAWIAGGALGLVGIVWGAIVFWRAQDQVVKLARSDAAKERAKTDAVTIKEATELKQGIADDEEEILEDVERDAGRQSLDSALAELFADQKRRRKNGGGTTGGP